MVGQDQLITAEWLKNVSLEKTEFQLKIGDLGFSKLQKNVSDMS